MGLRPYASGFVDLHPREGIAPSSMRNDELDLGSLLRERVETREFKGGMTGKCSWVSNI
jgi:hypothetical protein